MAGHIRGVAARILHKNPLALYTHCYSHVLNLVIVKSCSMSQIRNMFGTVQKVAESAKRTKYFEDAIHEIHTDSQRRRLKKHCNTRWIEQADALNVFVALYNAVIHALDLIKEECDGQSASSASLMSAAVQQFGFIVSLSSAEFVLNYTKPLSVMLQKSGLDICAASNEVRIIQKTLTNVRQVAEERFAKVYGNATKLAAEAGIEPTMPRICNRQTHRANPDSGSVSGQSTETYYRTTVFIPFIDNMVQGLNDRFTKVHQDVAVASQLVPSILICSARCTDIELDQLKCAYPDVDSNHSLSAEYDRVAC